jgi:hypothetical protein
MPKQDALVFALAALWGIFAAWIFTWLHDPVNVALLRVYEPMMKSLLHNGWTGEQILPYFHWATAVFPALLYGVIFGLPLGFLTERSIIATWVIFVAAFVATIAVRTLLAQIDILTLLRWLVYPIYWLTVLATLLFLFLGRRVRSAYAIHRAAT